MPGTLNETHDSTNAGMAENFAPAAGSPINLWLVDDNRRLRTTLAELFDRCDGIRCTATFHSPNAVLSALASKVGPDVILLDMHMGDANGLDVIRPIKSLSRSTQVLMLTTFFDSEAENRARDSGASGFLLKSFPLDRIVQTIRHARNHPAPHPKRRSCQTPSSSVGPVQNTSSTEQSPKTPVGQNGERSRKRLLWVKHCLDLIRKSRN